ncbi:hypothetical protein [Lentilitoribacter sp. Alg239-R112]|uniref:terminase small subunit-like protein n=1 Tax=Lentilitoribacter sp. Alg239-R112 TaxID=2305987 RepID=UPI0013A704DE|nr:hypothetical protein [Lentilitoribacter sp. Alg239-R112]
MTDKLIGRPSDYSQETADYICEKLCEGESLRAICLPDDMPNRSTVFRWLSLHDDFSNQYARAKEEQAEALADDIIAIADQYDTAKDILEPDLIQRAKLRIDSRKWVASKLKPKKYGDKVQSEISGPDGGPLQLNFVSDDDKL